MNVTLERRTHAETVELRSSETGQPVAQGYALKFWKRSQPMMGFVEQIDPAAVTKTLQEADIRALFNHEASMLLGRKAAGTLRVRADEVGVPYEIDLPNTTLGRDVAELLNRGDITGSSFGFRVVGNGEQWGETEDGYPLRTLTEIAMRDVSPVTFPAYLDTEASLRSLAERTGIEVRSLVELAQADDLIRAIRADSPKEIRRHRRVIV